MKSLDNLQLPEGVKAIHLIGHMVQLVLDDVDNEGKAIERHIRRNVINFLELGTLQQQAILSDMLGKPVILAEKNPEKPSLLKKLLKIFS